MEAQSDERKGRPSASSAEQMALCPASWLRQQGIAETFFSVADSGTRIHAVLAGDPGITLTPEEAETAAECKRLANELIASMDAGWASDREERYWCRHNLLSAKLDLLSFNPDLSGALVIDYKTGYNEVTPAADNLQMRWQFLAAWYGEDDFYVAVIAPHGNPQVTVARYGPEHYEPALAEARRIIAAAEAPDAPAIPGEKQCRYCRAKATCAEYQSYARQVLPAEIRELPVGAWTSEQRVRFVVAAKAAEKLLEEKLAEIKAEVERDPAGNPGLRLRPTGNVRSVDAQAVLAEGKIESWLLWQCATISVSKLEKRLADHCEWSKKEARAKLAELLGPLLETKPKAPSLEVV